MTIPYAEIDLAALQHNLDILRGYAPGSKILAVIKADAYGHGMIEVAQSLTHVYGFAVARLNEALTLRRAGITKPIVLLEGFFSGEKLSPLVDESLQCVVHCPEQAEAISNAKLDKPLTIWLKLDTGMHRLGFHPEQFNAVYQRLQNSPNARQPINLLSHFNRADELDCSHTTKQIALFKKYIQPDSGLKSLANSAALLAWPESHYDLVRPGLALYGLSPFAGKSEKQLQLKPVMTVKSQLIAVRTHKAGESIGYGAIWTASQDTKLGVVAMGYADGYPRTAPQGTPVLINGRIVPLVGRVSMDMITVDLGIQSTDKVGDQVTLWGEGLSATQVARHIGTISYELISKLTARVARHYSKPG